MGVFKYKGYSGSVEYSEKDDCLFGRVLGMNKDCISYEGQTLDELRRDFEGAVDDYLDDVSTTYVDYELLSGNTEEMAGILSDRSGEVRPGYRNPVGAQRGDDSLDDWYTFFGLNITVKLDFFSNLFGRHNKCEAY